jgi:hypothetical protein
MAGPSEKFGFGLVRTLAAAFGICSITWAVFSSSFYGPEALFRSSAQRILAGDNFSSEQLDLLKLKIGSTSAERVRSTALSDIATIRLRLWETRQRAGDASDLADLKRALSTALAEDPNDSFLWLIEYGIQDIAARASDSGLKFLRMSYLTGPNEAWIAVRRNPLALAAFSSLPDDLAKQAVSEFSDLVQSGLYQDASNILAGPGWAVRDKLLGRLAQVDESDRREFAKVVGRMNLQDVVIPGVAAPPARRF